MDERIRKIIDAGICAPSGDNCQPWRFEVGDNEIRIFNLPEKDTSLFNYRQRASLVAHGALIENILVVASALGYTGELELSPEGSDSCMIALITFGKGTVEKAPLSAFIRQRTTNRRRYSSLPLNAEQRTALLHAPISICSGNLRLIEDWVERKTIAEIIGLNDRLVFENPYLHDFLFTHIRWNDEESAKTRDGLDIKTLELAPLDAVAFKIFRNYGLLQVLNRFGVSRIVAKNAEKLAFSASAIGIITVPGSSANDYLNAGRIMQRAWLEATRLGLSFQLMTGITFLMQRVQEGETNELSSDHVDLIKGAYEKIKDVMRLENEIPAIMFRIGHSAPPSARSLRLPMDMLVRARTNGNGISQ